MLTVFSEYKKFADVYEKNNSQNKLFCARFMKNTNPSTFKGYS